MMVETILESSQDFVGCGTGMSGGGLPQWKRELLQRRAARARPPAPPPPPPPPPPAPADDDEELRYGPGIVKRLKSRYLSLALREAPRRRPSVLRRAASLEQLLDERPPPAPRPRAPRPASLAAPAALTATASPRRESVKRARSVDALSRLDSRDEPPSVPPPPPPPVPRSTRPPRRPAPLLRETERPPPDTVRSTLRKFESAPTRRPAPAARVSAVLRGLEALPRSSTPEPRGRSPSPAAADLSAIDEPEGATVSSEAKLVSRAALEGIARAGSSVRYSFEAPKLGSHLPLLSATNPVLLSRSRLSASPRRVGVIRPMPASVIERSISTPTPIHNDADEKPDDIPRIPSPNPYENDLSTPRQERKEHPPSAVVEPIPRSPASVPDEYHTLSIRPDVISDLPIRPVSPEPEPKFDPPVTVEIEIRNSKPLMNGHATSEKSIETKTKGASRIVAAGIERAWTGAEEKKCAFVNKDKKENGEVKSVVPSWVKGGGGESPAGARRLRAPAPAATSVVFNFSARKDVPDYIENDGIVLRASRRARFKAGEPGVVVLRPEALAAGSDSEEEEERPPSPCCVRFVNDNVLINGRSSMAAKPARAPRDRLKLQFDDSLTRTFEYPSETSLSEEGSASAGAPAAAPAAAPTPSPAPAPAPAPGPAASALSANTHIVSAALGGYTPHKTRADAFPLGLARRPDSHAEAERSESAEEEAGAGDARPCAADSARSWSEARSLHTDLLF